jgi:D-alanyl-D-alanine carboxypeptidase
MENLSIEDPVHKFFPDAPEAWRPIKIKNLMSHTSGLQREGPAYDNFKIQPDLDIIKSAYNLPLVFKPGKNTSIVIWLISCWQKL